MLTRMTRLIATLCLLASALAVLTAAPARASHDATSVAPGSLAQGRVDVPFTVTGTGFQQTLTSVTVSGSGVDVDDVTVVNSTTITGTVSVTNGATTGPRTVTVVQNLIDIDNCVSCLLIVARPTVTSIAPSEASNNAAGVTNVTVGGTDFQPGAQLTLVAGSFTVGATEGTTTPTALAATVDLRGQPPALLWDVVVTNPDQGTNSLNDGFSVAGGTPTLSGVAGPVGQGAVQRAVRLTGTNLARGAAVTVSPATGISVTAVNWVSLTAVDAVIDVASSAATGPRDVTITNTDTQSATLPGGLVINAGPTITSVVPNARGQGAAAISVDVTGTGFADGATLSIDGGGITISNVVVSATHVTADVAIDSAAAAGARTLRVTNPDGGTATSTFTVNVGPSIGTVAPSARGQGATAQTVIITGSGFVAGVASSFGAGVTVTSTTRDSATQLTVVLSVDPAATPGPRDVTVTNTDGGRAIKADGFTVGNGPVITSVTPPGRGQNSTNVSVTVAGSGFKPDAVVTFSGTGITINSSAVTATQITLDVSISAGAAVGPRDVTVTNTDGGTITSDDGFAVTAAPTVTSVDPDTVGRGGATTLSVVGSNFSGTPAVSFGSGVTVTDVVRVDAEHLDVDVTVASDAILGTRDVVVTNPDGGTSAPCDDCMTVSAAPTVTSITPSAGAEGGSVTITDLAGTGFQPGATVALERAGYADIALSVTSTTATKITGSFDLTDAAPGKWTVRVTNPDFGTARLTNGFTVTGSSPAITSVSPSSMIQGRSGTVTVNGSGFAAGTSLSVSGAGITVGATTVNAARTQLTATFTIAADAPGGERDVTATNTDAQTSTCTACFSVVNTPVVTGIAPSSLAQGVADVDVIVTGDHFQATPAVTVSGSGVTVTGVVHDSATQLTVTISVDSSAPTGARSVTVTNPDTGAVVVAGGLTITTGPKFTSMDPAAIAQGRSAQTVVITGSDFAATPTVAFTGTGVTVDSVVRDSATQLTLTVTVLAGAASGSRDITITNPDGGSVTSAAALAVVNAGGGFTGVTPARLLDTRIAGQGPCIGTDTTRDLKVTGVGGVPTSGVGAVAVNVTVAGATAESWLTVYPKGVTRPLASNLNFIRGQIIPNLVVVKAGTGGFITIYNSNGCADVIVDVVGWYLDNGGSPAAGGLTAVTPARLLDTRVSGQGPCLGANSVRELKVTDVGGVPASGVGAVAVNVTVTGPTHESYLTVYPKGVTRPLASNLNFLGGTTIPNLVVVEVGTGGSIAIYNESGCTQVIVDVVGWFTDDAGSVAPGGLTGVTPARLLDTRNASEGPCLAANTVRSLKVTGVGGVPATGVGAVTVNVTTAGSTAESYLTVYPKGVSRPLASNLNFVAGRIIPNLVKVKVGTGGFIEIYNASGCAHIIVDVVGWYAA